jgi:hypothetical protein
MVQIHVAGGFSSKAPHAWQPREEEAMTIESSVGLSRLEPSKYARQA